LLGWWFAEEKSFSRNVFKTKRRKRVLLLGCHYDGDIRMSMLLAAE
jgi:hypothetical protein